MGVSEVLEDNKTRAKRPARESTARRAPPVLRAWRQFYPPYIKLAAGPKRAGAALPVPFDNRH